jgi:hypothetical protein
MHGDRTIDTGFIIYLDIPDLMAEIAVDSGGVYTPCPPLDFFLFE